MPRCWLLLLLLCWCATVPAAPALSITLSNGEWPPYMGEKLPEGGRLSWVVSEAFASENVSVRYQFMPWVRALHDARQGRVAGSVGWLLTPDRQRDFLFSDPLYTGRVVMFYRRDSTAPWSPWRLIKGRRLGLSRGYDYGAAVWPALTQPSAQNTLDEAVDDLTNLKKLAAGYIDGFPCDEAVCWNLIQTHWPPAEQGQFATTKEALHESPIHLVINRQHEHAQELIERFNRGLHKLKRSPQWAQIMPASPR
ncbi:ABC transporter substrate-binding protein [Chitinibacter tainanensis]|uniref:substrate-binding periplasmic protein n=1 Tax=Chitinibacter tainanensis TaxID=230667 RepID=UPI00235587CE|nr:transporter substrate-binding domain-containing protein [Chitinibacter tainanensis]